jgi:hypothetical protein
MQSVVFLRYTRKLMCIVTTLWLHFSLIKPAFAHLAYTTLLSLVWELRCCAHQFLSNFLPTFRDNLSVPSSGFKDPKGSLYPVAPIRSLYTEDCGLWKVSLLWCQPVWLMQVVGRPGCDSQMGSIGRPETSVRNCHYWQRDNPEERSSDPFGGFSLKSRTVPCLLRRFGGTPPFSGRPIDQCLKLNRV